GDGQHGRSRSTKRRAAGHVLQGQADGLVAFDQIVVEVGDAQVLAGDARPKGERVVGGRRVVRAAGSAAAGNIDLHRDGAVAAVGAGDGNAGVACVFGDAVGGRAELQLFPYATLFRSGDGQHGRSRSTKGRAAAHVLNGQVDG